MLFTGLAVRMSQIFIKLSHPAVHTKLFNAFTSRVVRL